MAAQLQSLPAASSTAAHAPMPGRGTVHIYALRQCVSAACMFASFTTHTSHRGLLQRSQRPTPTLWYKPAAAAGARPHGNVRQAAAPTPLRAHETDCSLCGSPKASDTCNDASSEIAPTCLSRPRVVTTPSCQACRAASTQGGGLGHRRARIHQCVRAMGVNGCMHACANSLSTCMCGLSRGPPVQRPSCGTHATGNT